MKREQDKLIFKFSLLSICLLSMLATAISPALPLMYSAFPGVAKSDIETLATIPNLGIVVGLLISPFLIQYFGEKKTVIIGLVITLIAGTFPMYISNYMPILITRFFLGVGLGSFNSLSVSLIPEFYHRDENELAKMIGYQNVMGSVGFASASFLMSWLVVISWHAAFSIYLVVIPVLILFATFVKFPKEKDNTENNKPKKNAHHINKSVIWLAVLSFFIYVFWMPMSYKLPSLVVQEKLGSISEISILSGLQTLVNIPVGMFFGWLFKKIHDKIFPIGAALCAIGMLVIEMASSFILVALGMILFGIGIGLIVPYIFNWLDWSAPQDSINFATTIVLILVNAGCTVSPSIINVIAHNPKDAFLASFIFYVILLVYALYHYLRVHNHVGNK